MEKENQDRMKFWKGALAGALVTAVAGCGVLTGLSMAGRTTTPKQQSTETVSTGSNAVRTQINLKQVDAKLSVLQQIVDRYFLFDEDAEQMETGIYKGMMAGLDDPYTVYYTSEEYSSLTEETSGLYCGIGVLVSKNVQTGAVTALRVFPGSPAEEAGMQKGDILYKVQDVSATDEELDILVQEYIRGEEGTYVDVTVLRGTEEIPLHIERRMVEVATVEHEMLTDQTGYVEVSQFDTVTAEQFIAAVSDLEAQGMERLVIDLRDNPGGVVTSCVEMASYILPEDRYDGVILSTATKEGEQERYYCKDGTIRHDIKGTDTEDGIFPKTDDHELKIPIAVLINGQSASAAEVFAGALQDYGAAVLVGTTSFGKGIVQSVIPLTDGSAVKITTAHYYTPAGHDLHKKGLTPDVEVEQKLDEDLVGQYDIPLDRDNQVQAAIEALNK